MGFKEEAKVANAHDKKTLKLIDEVSQELDDALAALDNSVMKEMIAGLKLETNLEGNIVRNFSNLRKIKNGMRKVDKTAKRVIEKSSKIGEVAVKEAIEGGSAAFEAVTDIKVSPIPSKIQLQMTGDDTAAALKKLIGDKQFKTTRLLNNALLNETSLKDAIASIATENAKTTAHATSIMKDKLFGAYRDAQSTYYKENGYTEFKMVGPNDSKISDICKSHIGEVKTDEEWKNVKSDYATNGLHPRCRHRWLGVDKEDE